MHIGCVIFVGLLLTAELSECLECFNCQNIADPRACTNTSQCSNGQSCYLQTVHNGNDGLYNMGCQNNQLCTSSGVDIGGIIGRSIHRRQHVACHECCSTSGCNDQLCAHRKPSTCVDDPTLDCARMNSIFNVCADVHHAKATCPNFCGLCQLVDGNWGDWVTWATCSVTCQNGTQTRARSCTNPPPSNGGLDCSGSAVQTKICSNQLCPVHGNWSDWSTWSGCSVTCNVGVRTKTRTCTNPRPDRSGDYCVGEPSEYTVCLNEPCGARVHGNWSDWSKWSGCSVTCDVGLRERTRTCSNQTPERFDDFCVGNPSEYTVCLTDPCVTRNGDWSSWGSYQGCSVTCGVGLKLRNRTCTNPSPSAYGKACEGNTEAFAVCVNRPCTTVAFFAHGINTLANLVGAFPIIVLNEGNAYSSSTGHFTAPVNGIYSFAAQVCTNGNHFAYYAIMKGNASMNNTTHIMASLRNGPALSCGSASTHVELSKNEHVWVHIGPLYDSTSLYEHGEMWNFFTGALTQEI